MKPTHPKGVRHETLKTLLICALLLVAGVTAAQAPAFPDAIYVDRKAFTDRAVIVTSGRFELPGVLSTPASPRRAPAVVIIGDGTPRDMNGAVGANRPWQDLAHGLASNGIAVLRYTPRPLVYPREFVETWTIEEELLQDAEAAVKTLARQDGIDPHRVYVLALGRAAWAAPILAQRLKPIHGFALLNAPAKFNPQRQYKELVRLTEAGEGEDPARLHVREPEPRMLAKRAFPRAERVLGHPAGWWYHLADLDPTDRILDSKARFFVAYGALDYTIIPHDRETWEQFLKQTNRRGVRTYAGADHLFLQRMQKEAVLPRGLEKPGHVSGELIDELVEFLSE